MVKRRVEDEEYALYGTVRYGTNRQLRPPIRPTQRPGSCAKVGNLVISR